MKCKEYRNKISEALDERLDPAVREAFDAHGRECPVCAEALEALAREEKTARNATEIAPRDGFEKKVLARIAVVPPTLQEAYGAAQPRANRFRMPFGVAAGVLIGALLGVAGHRILSPSTRPATPPIESATETGSALEKAKDLDVDRARENVGTFFDASESLATDISNLSWIDPYADALTLNRIVNALEMEKKLKEAEKMKPILQRSEPRCAPALDNLIDDQRFIVQEVSSYETFRPDTVDAVRARARNSLANLNRIRAELQVRKPRHILLNFGKGRSGGFSFQFKADSAIDYLTEASRRELKGDACSALALYRDVTKKFPESHLKGVTLGRIVRLLKTDGRAEVVIQFVDEIPELFKPGELPLPNQIQIEGLLEGLEVDSKKIGKIFELLNKHGPQRWRFRKILSVKLNEHEILVDRRTQGRAWSLYHKLTHDGWTRPRETIQHTKDGVRDVSIRFEKQGKLSPSVAYRLKRFLAGVEDAPAPDEVTRIVFSCR
ncbi:MAG: anti-sigma factor family protein [Planctomycetota bacterium]|jgi:hypothetical protein